MDNRFQRTELLLGEEAMRRLAKARVAVFGVGGVGGFAVEALARSGVGRLDLIDSDRVDLTNINRQIIATSDTVGEYKVDAAKARVLSINPECIVNTHRVFFLPETASGFDLSVYDYIIDAVDTVSAKLELALGAQKANTPIISAMGAGNKLDPTAFEVCDISKTSVCPLARVMRLECRKRGIKKLKVVYSKEQAVRPFADIAAEVREEDDVRRDIPGSMAFVPSVAGLIIAGEVIKELLKK